MNSINKFKVSTFISLALILGACGERELPSLNSDSSNSTTSISSSILSSSSISISSSIATFTITWQNQDGTVLETDTNVTYGSTPTFNSLNPTKMSTDDYDYSFTGWLPTIVPVTANVTYVAQFTENLNYIPITNAQELSNIRNNLSGNYRLMNDIDLESIEWQPIGAANLPFSGTLDGREFTISNLTITQTQEYVGLFANNSGTIKNLKIDNVQINVTGSISSFICAGSLVALSSGIIENITSIEGTLNAKSRSGNLGYIGGLVGWIIGGTLQNIQNNLEVSSDYSTFIGGLVGYSTSNLILTNLINRGHILTSSEFVGGIIGKSNNTLTIIESGNEGDITGVNNVGGVLGSGRSNFSVSIHNSYNAGTISGSSYIGGFVGFSFELNITESTNFGNISGFQYIGGFVGHVDKGNSLILNSINKANIVATGVISGGLIGYSGATTVITISNSLCLGAIFGGDGVVDGTGGFVGLANNKLFVYSSLFIGEIVLLNQVFSPYYLGGIVGLVGGLSDFDNAFYLSTFSIGNNVFVEGNQFGTKVTDISIFNLAFFTTTLGWDTEIWDFTGLNIANGVYPTLKNMPVVEDQITL